MNRLVFVNINIFVIAIGLCLVAKADYIAPEIPTQVNEPTDLFDKSINDYSGFTNKLEQGKQAGIDSLGGENGIPEGLQYISKDSKSQLTSESQKLESIHENDLASKGREEIIKEGHLQKLYPDYNRPGYKQHLQDAKTIAKAQDELLKHLLEKLKALGVDCKTVKGDKKVEPEYFLQTKTTTHKDTLYNQVFCEELRNQYNCRDELSLTCKRFGKGYKEWEARTIRFNGHVLHNTKPDWGYAIKWKDKRWGWHIAPYHPNPKAFGGEVQVDSVWRNNPAAIIADARGYIAMQLGASIDQIGEHVVFPDNNGGRGLGNISPVGARWRVAWDEYEFAYMYRDVFDTCEEWQEDWTERCAIK